MYILIKSMQNIGQEKAIMADSKKKHTTRKNKNKKQNKENSFKAGL